MFYYAYLDEEGFCYSIGRVANELPKDSNLVKLTSYSLEHLGQKFDKVSQEWLSEFIPKPISILPQQEIINAQILNKLEYLECITELNSMKGGNL